MDSCIVYRTGSPNGNQNIAIPKLRDDFIFGAPSLLQAGRWAEFMQFAYDAQLSVYEVSRAFKWHVGTSINGFPILANMQRYDTSDYEWDGKEETLQPSGELVEITLKEVIFYPRDIIRVRPVTDLEYLEYLQGRREVSNLTQC
jgi:hypothetical protein